MHKRILTIFLLLIGPLFKCIFDLSCFWFQGLIPSHGPTPPIACKNYFMLLIKLFADQILKSLCEFILQHPKPIRFCILEWESIPLCSKHGWWLSFIIFPSWFFFPSIVSSFIVFLLVCLCALILGLFVVFHCWFIFGLWLVFLVFGMFPRRYNIIVLMAPQAPNFLSPFDPCSSSHLGF